MEFIKKYIMPTWQRFAGSIVGNVILAFGVALLRVSGMGNDPFNATVMAYSDATGIGIGTICLIINIILLSLELWLGKEYLGFGAAVNLLLLGYIVEFALWFYGLLFGSDFVPTLPISVLLLILSVALISYGLSMYQLAALGVAPYDFLPMYTQRKNHLPFFANRMFFDVGCIGVILIGFFCGIVDGNQLHIGIGTAVCAFGLGPAIQFFDRFNRPWICSEHKEKSEKDA